MNGIRIKTEHKTEQTTAGLSADARGAAATAAAVPGYQLLRQTGFDEKTARYLALKRSLETIQRQMAWLPLRHTTRNRLGLLRRAIEQDWSRPEGAVEEPDQRLGRLFASHDYAAYHGYAGEAATDPFPKDVQLAAKFVQRLLAVDADEAHVPEWGRRFGALIRDKHRGDAKAKPNLSFALVLYGDEFLRAVQAEGSGRQKEAQGKAREACQVAFMPDYLTHLRLAEAKLQRTAAGLYAAFVEERRRTRHAMTGGLFLASAETLARFEGEESRLLAFAEFFRNHAEYPVPDFWQWENQRNSLAKQTPLPASVPGGSVPFPPVPATDAGERTAAVGAHERSAAS